MHAKKAAHSTRPCAALMTANLGSCARPTRATIQCRDKQDHHRHENTGHCKMYGGGRSSVVNAGLIVIAGVVLAAGSVGRCAGRTCAVKARMPVFFAAEKRRETEPAPPAAVSVLPQENKQYAEKHASEVGKMGDIVT